MAAHAFLLTAVFFHLGIHAAYASFFCNSCRAVPGGTCDAGFDSDDCNYDSEALNEELGTEFYCSDLRSLGAGRSLRSGLFSGAARNSEGASLETCDRDMGVLNAALGTNFQCDGCSRTTFGSCRVNTGTGSRHSRSSDESCNTTELNELNKFTAPLAEKSKYTVFYIASSGTIVIMLICAGCLTENRCIDCEGVSDAEGSLFFIIFLVRTYDMFSDWGFFAISVRHSGLFALLYAEQGGDPVHIWAASLAFCILGLLLYVPDLLTTRDGDRAPMLLCVLLFEDVPQLVLNVGYYLPTVGFENIDPIAVFSLVTSCLSIMLNCMLFLRMVTRDCRKDCCRKSTASVMV